MIALRRTFRAATWWELRCRCATGDKKSNEASNSLHVKEQGRVATSMLMLLSGTSNCVSHHKAAFGNKRTHLHTNHLASSHLGLWRANGPTKSTLHQRCGGGVPSVGAADSHD